MCFFYLYVTASLNLILQKSHAMRQIYFLKKTKKNVHVISYCTRRETVRLTLEEIIS